MQRVCKDRDACIAHAQKVPAGSKPSVFVLRAKVTSEAQVLSGAPSEEQKNEWDYMSNHDDANAAPHRTLEDAPGAAFSGTGAGVLLESSSFLAAFLPLTNAIMAQISTARRGGCAKATSILKE